MRKRCAMCKSEQMESVDLSISRTIGELEFFGMLPGQRCSQCGEEYFGIEALGQFEVRIAGWLAQNAVRSAGAFRFMHRAIGLTGVELANLLDVTQETISHWSKGVHPIPRAAAALLESIVLDHISGKADTITRLSSTDPGLPRKVQLPRCA